jgi:hypothetical protein
MGQSKPPAGLADGAGSARATTLALGCKVVCVEDIISPCMEKHAIKFHLPMPESCKLKQGTTYARIPHPGQDFVIDFCASIIITQA